MVYAATDSLYVSNDVYTQWLTMMDDKQEDWQVSAIHRFHIGAEGKKAMYESTGVVPGSILNQFSMGEHDGHLRVATTRNMWDSGTIENAVTVLNAVMDQVGQIEGIAPGERIYSARFIDDKGYVVTFEQIDPLFTLDLSDPTNPTIVGELKIPGFSTYIHPVGDGHLLTIGEETEDMGDWVQTIGMKLEIFDVSDLANPQSTHKFVFESGYYSEALYEHKAFNFHADLGLLAIPVNGYGWSGGGGGGDAPTVFVQDTAEEESPSSSGGGSSSDNGTDEDDGDEDSASGTSSAPVPVPIDEDEDEDEDGDEDSWEEEEGWTEEEEWIEEKEWEEPDHKVGLGVFTIDTTDGVDELGFIDHADFMNEENNWWYGEEVRRSLIMGDHVFSIGRLGLKIATADDLSITASVEFPEDNGPEMGKGVSGGTGGGFSTPPSTTTDPEPMPDDAPEETPEDTDEGDEGSDA